MATDGRFSKVTSFFKKILSKEKAEVNHSTGNVSIPDIERTKAFWPVGGDYRWNAKLFNGEKNLGELGPINFFLMDYYALRWRAWQAWIENPNAQTLERKYTNWVIGKRLKLQAEPNQRVIGSLNKNLKEFSESTEALWDVYSKSRLLDYSNEKTFNQIQAEVHKNAIFGGDVLVILRVINGYVKVQLVDGAHLRSPQYGTEWWPKLAANGNRVINGVEINDNGEHEAYYVVRPFDSVNTFNIVDVERIPTKIEGTDLRVAFLVYGLKFRMDTHRGIPIIAAALEKLKKIERYEDATLGSAEEQAKITYQIKHDVNSTGEDPFTKQLITAHDVNHRQSDLGVDDASVAHANRVQVTTNKQAINNPPGAEIKTLETNESQLYFKDFLEKNFDTVCSMIMMPPDVALSRYNSNYSASRAAIKDWEHVLSVARADFGAQFLDRVYTFWLDIMILTNKIQAPGYLLARQRGDQVILESYRLARWIGAPVANIDPLKEVQAERAKLGILGAALPLTTVEQAVENINGGDSDHITEQYSEELEYAKSLGIEMPEPTSTQSVSEKV